MQCSAYCVCRQCFSSTLSAIVVSRLDEKRVLLPSTSIAYGIIIDKMLFTFVNACMLSDRVWTCVCATSSALCYSLHMLVSHYKNFIVTFSSSCPSPDLLLQPIMLTPRMTHKHTHARKHRNGVIKGNVKTSTLCVRACVRVRRGR